ncbi:MAG: hypothetical protein WBG95_03445 [Sulfitobacter sp.]
MPKSTRVGITTYWYALAIFILCASASLRLFAPLFAYGRDIASMPVLPFVFFYVAVAGIVAISVPLLAEKTPQIATTRLLYLILFVGAAARLMQLGAPTILEDDFYRYLWDGAVVAAGENPFLYAPFDVEFGDAGGAVLAELATQAGGVLDRINYPEYRTVYPPVAQAVFALSHYIAPFDLDGWRVVLFLMEVGCVIAILLILPRYGRSPLWIAVYWWNPLVIKEVANSAHMEPALMLPMLVAAVLVLRRQGVWASLFLTVAAGVKIWPLLTLATIWRQYLVRPKLLMLSGLMVAVGISVFLWPIYRSGLDETSGFVAFAQNWRASSIMIILTEWLSALVPSEGLPAGALPRLMLGMALAITIFMICFKRAYGPRTTMYRMFLIAVAIYLLSPSQTPWYFLWIVPFLCIFPARGLMLAGILVPLHYLFFYLDPRGLGEVYRYGVVWVIWLPVWALLAYDYVFGGPKPTAKITRA